jgi:hypothetical protein
MNPSSPTNASQATSQNYMTLSLNLFHPYRTDPESKRYNMYFPKMTKERFVSG